MDLNFNNNVIMMDYIRLETEIRRKAQEYLDDISEGNLKAFVESAKYIAKSVLENYFLSIDDVYTNGPLKIKDCDIFNKFIDFHDGYRAQMKKWVSDNEMTIGEMKITPTLKYPDIEDEDIIKRPLAIAGVGTLVAVGLIIFTEMWIAVAAELLALSVAAYVYNKSKKSREKKYAFREKMYEMKIEQEKVHLVNGLIKDLKIWLGNAETFSNYILVSLDIK